MQTEYHHYSFTPHAGALDLLLVRHGECERAIAGHPFSLVDGHGDPALHADGAAQAITVGARLRDEPLMPLYVTTLRRTHQTVAPLEVHLGLTPVIEADFREVYFGDWEGGLFRIKATQSAPEVLRARAQHNWGEITGADTCAALKSRVVTALWRLAARHPDQQIAAFMHSRVIGEARAAGGAANNQLGQELIRSRRLGLTNQPIGPPSDQPNHNHIETPKFCNIIRMRRDMTSPIG